MQRPNPEVDALDGPMIGMMPRPVWPGKAIAKWPKVLVFDAPTRAV
jgi:hypothetical protein